MCVDDKTVKSFNILAISLSYVITLMSQTKFSKLKFVFQ